MTTPRNHSRYSGPWSCPTSALALPVSAPREEWLAMRRTGIGGSDAATLMGAGRYEDQTPWFVWQSKTQPTEEVDKLIYRRGHELEPIIAARFEEEHPKHWRTRRAGLHRNREDGWLIASVDRLTADGGGLEMKSTISREFRRWLDEYDGEPPDHYLWQCLHYMLVTGRTHWYLAVLVTDTWEFHWWRIDWDSERIELMRVVFEEWWRTHVIEGVEPDPSDLSNAKELKARWPLVTDAVLELESGGEHGRRLAELLDERRRLKGSVKDDELVLASIDGQLREIAQGHETVKLDGRKAYTLKESSTRRLDTTKLKESAPDVYDQFVRTSHGRRLYVAMS